MQIILNNGIDNYIVDETINRINYIQNKTEDLEVLINSPGGEVFSGFALYNALKSWAGKVTTIITGQASSIAAIIYLSGKEKRVYKNSTLMFHKSSGFVEGTASELEAVKNILLQIDNILIDNVCETTKKKRDEVEKLLENEWYLIGGENIKAEGLADEVIDIQNKKNKSNIIFNICKKDVKNMTNEEAEKQIEALKASVEEMKTLLKNLTEEKAKNESDKKDPENKDQETNEAEQKAKDEKKADEVIANALSLLKMSGIEIPSDVEKAIKNKTRKEEFAVNLLENGAVKNSGSFDGVAIRTATKGKINDTDKKAAEIVDIFKTNSGRRSK